MDDDMWPNIVDYWGPSGMVFLRNPQIRWTPINYLVARVLVSVVSGLTVFLLNAVLNFRRL